jgi:hypothetical protein
MENTRKASDTESVPSAESLRPVKGNVSTPLALAVDVDPADLVDQRVDQIKKGFDPVPPTTQKRGKAPSGTDRPRLESNRL